MKAITQMHCQSCGSTDEESIGYDAMRETDGYSACCNEIVVMPAQPATIFSYATLRDVPVGPAKCDPNVCYHD